MSLDPRRRNSRSSPLQTRTAASLDSTRGRGGGLSGATKVYVRGECGEDGWVTSAGEAPLSWWFLFGVVLALESSIYSSSSGWANSAVGQTTVSIPYSETL